MLGQYWEPGQHAEWQLSFLRIYAQVGFGQGQRISQWFHADWQVQRERRSEHQIGLWTVQQKVHVDTRIAMTTGAEHRNVQPQLRMRQIHHVPFGRELAQGQWQCHLCQTEKQTRDWNRFQGGQEQESIPIHVLVAGSRKYQRWPSSTLVEQSNPQGVHWYRDPRARKQRATVNVILQRRGGQRQYSKQACTQPIWMCQWWPQSEGAGQFHQHSQRQWHVAEPNEGERPFQERHDHHHAGGHLYQKTSTRVDKVDSWQQWHQRPMERL